MLLTVASDVSTHPVGTLTTVQNDWRDPGGDAHALLDTPGLPDASPRSMQLFTSDPAGDRGPGRHLVLFESATSPDDTVAAWHGVGTAGQSPVPPYTTLFGVVGEQAADQPDQAPVWVAHWRHLVTVGR
jgi:hypothetical protein